MKHLIEDNKGNPSKTAFILVVTMVIVWIKFLFEGMTISFPGVSHAITFGKLDPALVAAIVGAAGTLYAWRRGQDIKERTGIRETDELVNKLKDVLKE